MIRTSSAARSSPSSRAVSCAICSLVVSACAAISPSRSSSRASRPEGQRPAGHAPRQAAAVAAVSRRSITAVIAQYTRDSELRGRCS
ncbi:hypothetical protein [Streptomyces bicolor]|uniref:hypothetical protein n=1 Tax=Streptomyces bicolor TaxID=66874 RepID=UPI003F6A0CF0